MNDDNWSRADDLAFRIEAAGSRHPLRAAAQFIAGVLLATPIDTRALERIVTPESRSSWGDFAAVRVLLEGIESAGFASDIPPPADPRDIDIAEVSIVSGVTAFTNLEPGDRIEPQAVMTLVWRPEFGTWLVHAVGSRIPAERLAHARTSPGSGPEWR